MLRVYVAGAISSNKLENSLYNIREGLKIGKRLLLNGYAPFIPHLDFLLNLVEGNNISVETYYEYDFEMLRACEVMLVCDYAPASKGVCKEIEFATENEIPIFYNLSDLDQYRRGL